MQHIEMDPKKVTIGPSFDELVFGTNKFFSSPFGEDPNIPTPLASPSASSVEEDEAIEILVEQLLSLNIRLSKFGE